MGASVSFVQSIKCRGLIGWGYRATSRLLRATAWLELPQRAPF